MTDPLIGKQVGQFEILSLIGHGGMADVYRAHQLGTKRDVALKVLSAQLAKTPDFVSRFDREVELIAGLEHAHIVPVYDHGRTPEGSAYLAMRLIKGGTLAERISAGPLPLELANKFMQQLSSALDYAHSKGVTHRDIKPSNMLIDDQDDIYLADFGLAQFGERSAHKSNLTRTGTLVGTPTYISPEQAVASKSDSRSDIYSLGVVLYEMVTGKPPFMGDSLFTIMQAHVNTLPPDPRKLRPDLGPGIVVVLEKALAKKPEDRYQNATDLSRDFSMACQGLLTTQPHLLPRVPGSSTLIRTLGEMGRSRRTLAVGVATIVILTLALLVISQINRGGSPGTAPSLADESARPETGQPDSIALTPAEIEVARQAMKGSFVGIMPCTLETEWHSSYARGARARAAGYGFEVKIEDPKAERSRQPAILNQFIAQGAKVIVMCPLDEELLKPAVQAAQESGVLIMTTGDTVYGKGAITFTITNQTMGEKVGEYTAQIVNAEMGGKAKAIILDYPDVPAVIARADGMEKMFLANAPESAILGRYLGGLFEEGEKSLIKALEEHPDLNVIMSINDAGAFGAIKTLRAAGKGPEDVIIVSVDAESEARRMVAAGEYLRGTLDNDPVGTAQLAVDGAVKMLSGAVTPRQLLLPGLMITKENVELSGTVTPTP
ncbi:MAG: substrate-binding domain-containing protein [Anaerolineae bacterium]|nr:substrate-binding domain-containing protein [Anaerolineae bacterium]